MYAGAVSRMPLPPPPTPYTAPMGYSTTLFVSPPPAALICSICHEVLRTATTACAEGHAFCKYCLAVPSITKCPTCRGSLQKTNCLPLQNIIEGLQVRCPNRAPVEENNGKEKDEQSLPTAKKRRKSSAAQKTPHDCCNWIGKLLDLEKHQADVCKFKMVECEHEGCNLKVLRRNLKKHLSQCFLRPSRCNKCKQTVPHNRLTNHNCPKEMTTCPYCNKRMLREELLGAGAPNYYRDNEDEDRHGTAMNPSLRVAGAASGNGGSNSCYQAEDDEGRPNERETISPASGREVLIDILNEKKPFIPTDAECEGHYKVCPNVPLRCEFHQQGCTTPIIRKELAHHHATHAQQHARLVANAFAKIPQLLERSLKHEHTTLVFEVPSYNLRGHKNCWSSSSTVAGFSMRLKLYLHRDEDEPVAVAIRCTDPPSMNETITISDIHIRITKARDEETTTTRNGFQCSGAQKLERRSGEYNDAVEFSTPLNYKEEGRDCCFMTGSHLVELAESNQSKVYVMASFSIAKRNIRNLGGVFSTTSPSPSPSPSRDYGDY